MTKDNIFHFLAPRGLIVGGLVACLGIFLKHILIGVMPFIEQKIISNWFFGNDILMFIIVLFCIWLFFFLGNVMNYVFKGKRDFSPRGNNQLAEEKYRALHPKIEKEYLTKKPRIFTIGKSGNRYFSLPENIEGNAIIVGPPGSGKSSGIILNTLIHNFNVTDEKDRFTVFCFDIKPELKRLSVAGSKNIRIISPNDMDGNGFDPFFGLTEDSTDDEIIQRMSLISAAIISNPSESGENKFFYSSAQNLLTGFLSYAYLQGKGLCDSIMQIKIVGTSNLIAEIINDDEIIEKHPKILALLKEYDGEIQGTEGFQSIIMTLLEPLDIFTRDSVRYALQDAEKKTDPSELSAGISQFLCLPDNLLQQYEAVFRVITELTLKYLASLSEEKRRKSNQKKILVLIDEAGSIGKIPFLLESLARLRSRKVLIWLAFQSFGQFEACYGLNGVRTIIDTCETFIAYGTHDTKTMETFQAWSQKFDRQRESRNKKPGKILGGSQSITESYEWTSSLDLYDIFSLKKNKEVLVFFNSERYLIDKRSYFEIPEYRDISQTVQEINEAKNSEKCSQRHDFHNELGDVVSYPTHYDIKEYN